MNELRLALAEFADSIHAHFGVPTDLHAVCKEIGLPIEYSVVQERCPAVDQGDSVNRYPSVRAELIVGRRNVINVYRLEKERVVLTRERFAIAHELAHYFIYDRFRLFPNSADYWMHEALCDTFAANLLAPRCQVISVLERLSADTQPAWPTIVAKELECSWDVAAAALADVYVPGSTWVKVHSTENCSSAGYRVTGVSTISTGRGRGLNAKLRGKNWESYFTQCLDGRIVSLETPENIGKLDTCGVQSRALRNGSNIQIFLVLNSSCSRDATNECKSEFDFESLGGLFAIPG